MYFWKCWRDTRAFFLVFAFIASAALPVAGAVGVGANLIGGFGATVVVPTTLFILFVMALGLGTISAIQEFTDKTAHFLFTKPRTRTYFVWSSWAVGCAELMVIGLLTLSVGWLTTAHYSKSPLRSVLITSIPKQDIARLFIYALFIYSLTYCLTAVLRNGLKGLGASIGSLAGYQGLAFAIHLKWNVTPPILPLPIGSLPPLISNLVWIFGALLFVVAAQLAVERAEI
jgi:ABC-type transport system involved in multi-copper enzyme maturation permease subunit